MLNLYRLTIDHLVKDLKSAYQRTYNSIEPEIGSIVGWTGRLALEIIANTDALYHNLHRIAPQRTDMCHFFTHMASNPGLVAMRR